MVRGRVFRAGEDEQQQSPITIIPTTMATAMIHQEARSIHLDHNLAEEGVNQIGGVDNVS
jgi:hypothetical protein